MQEVDHKTGKDHAHMSYETAPATKMLATHCAICARPLVDALSVETGIGPVCREEGGYNIECDPEAREAANAIVYKIALGVTHGECILQCLALRCLGFDKLADTILKKRALLVIEDWGDGTLAVFTPYSSSFVADLKAATPWRKFDGAQKCWLVPAGQKVKNQIFRAMCYAFPGSLGIGPKGPFTTPAAE